MVKIIAILGLIVDKVILLFERMRGKKNYNVIWK
jgi:hypothetical protein